jgi:flagellar biosynthetic protein FlhB
MAEDSLQEKTEPATPQRREEARRRGQVARSNELNSFAVVFFGMLFLFFAAPTMISGLLEVSRDVFAGMNTAPGTDADAVWYMRTLGWQVLAILVPLFAAVVAVGVFANASQVGFRVSPKAMEPKLDKFNFVSGLKRLISRRSLVDLIRNVLKLALIAAVAYFAVRAEEKNFLTLADLDTAGILKFAGGAIFRVGIKIVLALLALAVFDYLYQKWDFEKSIRMTKHEIKEEMKRYEGSPLVRARIRQVQRELARMRMTKEIPTADVVVTNPTHLAVALKYDTESMSAPTVVAKGARLLAEKIRDIARKAGVPVVENAPLARALYSSVEVGAQIPAELYKACAEVLAYIYRLRGKASAEPQLQGASEETV